MFVGERPPYNSPLNTKQLMTNPQAEYDSPWKEIKELERDFKEEFKLYQEENRMRYVTSFERLAKEEGKEEGSREATLTLILRQLTRRIGAVDSQAQEKIRQLSLEHLESLAEALLDFTGTADLSDWLNNHTN